MSTAVEHEYYRPAQARATERHKGSRTVDHGTFLVPRARDRACNRPFLVQRREKALENDLHGVLRGWRLLEQEVVAREVDHGELGGVVGLEWRAAQVLVGSRGEQRPTVDNRVP